MASLIVDGLISGPLVTSGLISGSVPILIGSPITDGLGSSLLMVTGGFGHRVLAAELIGSPITGGLGSSLLMVTAGFRTAPLPADLVEAVQAYLLATLVASGRVAWVGSGMAPPGTALPFVLVGDLDQSADYQEDGSDTPPYDDEGSLPIRVVATTRKEAKDIAVTISARHTGGLTLASLLFASGQLLSIRRIAMGAPILEDDLGPNGEQVWVAHLMFATITAKTL